MHRIVIAATALLLAACGGADSTLQDGASPQTAADGSTDLPGLDAGALPGPDASLADAGSARPATAPGATGPSSASGSGQLRLATVPALFFLDQPAPGEASFTGLVIATSTQTPVTDLVVSLNGVELMHSPGLASSYYQIDPSKPPPTLGADGMVHLRASSATLGKSCELDLACPSVPEVISQPAEGSSLTGVASLELSWSSPLPVNTPGGIAAVGLAPPAASLFGLDLATGSLAGEVETHAFDPAASSTALKVGTTSATGYLAELRYPGIAFVDGESGGACGRAARLRYAR